MAKFTLSEMSRKWTVPTGIVGNAKKPRRLTPETSVKLADGATVKLAGVVSGSWTDGAIEALVAAQGPIVAVTIPRDGETAKGRTGTEKHYVLRDELHRDMVLEGTETPALGAAPAQGAAPALGAAPANGHKRQKAAPVS
jgi:hypothetical protein